MTWMILLTTFLVAFAQNEDELPKCQTSVGELSLSGTILNEFIRPATNPEVLLPTPMDRCVKTGDQITIRDPFGERVGSVQVTGFWRGIYSEKAAREAEPKSPIRAFSQKLDERGMGPNPTIPVLLRSVFGVTQTLREPVQIFSGTLRLESGYFLNWNSSSGHSSMRGVRAMDYPGMVTHLMNKGSVLAAAFGGSSFDTNIWRMPGAIIPPPGLQCESNCLFGWRELQSYSRNSEDSLRNLDRKAPLAIYSSVLNPMAGMNAIEWLKSEGFEDIRWMKAAPEEWNTPELREADKQPRNFETISAEELAKIPREEVLIVDVRPRQDFFRGHIRGAKSSEVILFDKSQRLKDPGTEAARGILRITIMDIYRGQKEIVVYGDNADPLYLWIAERTIRGELSERVKIPLKIRVYTGGLADWTGRNEWLDPKLYGIERQLD